MLSEQAKKVFADLNLPYSPVALKFCRNRPEGYAQAEGVDVFCAYLKKAQTGKKPFYTTVDNDKCMGRVVLGMTDLETHHGSGQVGAALGVFKTPAPNARLYYDAPTLKRGVCNYVVFSALDECTFDPDLLVCIADTYEAQLILRAASYISGDLWESKCSYVMSCAWTYVYPYISGKVNHLFTGMHLGLQLQNAYPPGLHILSIPYQKIGEVVTALAEMRREPLDMTEEVEKMRDDITIPIRID
jgi:uncharacterized protein (DUF169 family)